MDLPCNAFKAALKARQLQKGMWCTIPDAGVIEMLAGCGYDWMLIDTEHSPLDAVGCMPLMQAAAPYPVTTVLRPGWNDAVEIKKMLDCGAQSLLIPYVQTAQEAAAAVAATRYAPEGMRGVAAVTRATRYGAIPQYHKRAAEELCLLVQVETVEALEQLDEIAAVPGVDGVFIGPGDLAASMGLAGETGHPDVQAKVVEAIARITALGQAAGLLAADPGFLREAEAAGALFMAVGVDMALLRKGALAQRDVWQG
jgi:4-hydroxy-2-oxoheptanedioate aldolase